MGTNLDLALFSTPLATYLEDMDREMKRQSVIDDNDDDVASTSSPRDITKNEHASVQRNDSKHSNDSNEDSAGDESGDENKNENKRDARSLRVTEIPLRSVKLGALLGRGAFGAVYIGAWNKRAVAVKKMHAGSAGIRTSDLKSFAREVTVLSTLKHPKIVRLYGACLKPPQLCIVEELVDGGSLHALLHVTKREMTLEDVLRVALDVGQAMEYLHAKRIVHRDLKSHNVLLYAHGAKVCDFGIARALERTLLMSNATKSNNSATICGATSNGTTAGTPAYMAPELFHGDAAAMTTACDVYSYSVLLWEMLAREIPWDWCANHMQIIFAVAIQSQRLPLDTHETFKRTNAEMRSLVDDVIVRCWQAEPCARPDFIEVNHTVERLLRRSLEAHKGDLA
jgi:serine/threonine protein kinase